MLKLKEGFINRDYNKMISSLLKLREPSKNCKIDCPTFKILIELIKMQNVEILNYTLSILANCCLNNSYRTMFKELGGLQHLIVIVQTAENDSIICRACRLIGNLAINSTLAKEMCNYNVRWSLIELLERHENLSSGTLRMTLRAMKNVWAVEESEQERVPDNLMPLFDKHLNSEDEQVVKIVIKFLTIFSKKGNIQKRKKIEINKQLFLKLLELSNNENLNHLVISCLSNLICYQTLSIWSYLEGSTIAEVFINYFKETDCIEGNIYKAFYKLCTEVTIRSQVRLSGLLPRLIDISDPSNAKSILSIFYLFQYDLVSLKVCSQNPKFVTLLFDNILLPKCIHLLKVLSRLDSPVKELVLDKNLDVIIQNKDCHGILKNIIRTRQFLKPLVISGKVWQIEKAGCSFEDICTPAQVECLLIQVLNTKEKKWKEDVSLAVPFLVKPRNFELLYKLLAHHQVMTTILNLLQKRPTDEKVLATVIRLIKIFRCNYHKPNSFFQYFTKGEILSADGIPEVDCGSFDADSKLGQDESTSGLAKIDSEVETVTFELDCGDCVVVNKNLLCENSPVFNSMLNGYFMEAKQEKIKLRKCTKECLLHLVSLLSGKTTYSDIKMNVYLQLLTVTDMLLLTSLNSALTENLKIDINCCSSVYEWYRNAGHTESSKIIGQKIYDFVFDSSENLLQVMKNETSKNSLVSDIYQYLFDSLKDLL